MLDYLETFLAVAEEQTMSRAATRLCVTQSAVSKRTSALQAQLGATLFHRVADTFS
jgi:DNA-binding transcriptional LysR family regulator